MCPAWPVSVTPSSFDFFDDINPRIAALLAMKLFTKFGQCQWNFSPTYHCQNPAWTFSITLHLHMWSMSGNFSITSTLLWLYQLENQSRCRDSRHIFFFLLLKWGQEGGVYSLLQLFSTRIQIYCSPRFILYCWFQFRLNIASAPWIIPLL